MTRVDFKASSDTGRNDSDSIEPVVNSDLPIAQNLGRPDERLRARTAHLQTQVNKADYRARLLSDYVVTSSSANTRAIWEGKYAGGTKGRVILSGAGADIVLLPRMGAGVTRDADLDDEEATLAANRRAYFDLLIDDGSTTATVRAIVSDDYDLVAAQWLSIEITVTGSVFDIELQGTDPVDADLGFLPGASRVVVTVPTSYTATDLAEKLDSELPTVFASAAVASGTASTQVVDLTVDGPTCAGIVGHAIRITAAKLATFFATSTGNRLRLGDSLGVYLGDIADLARWDVTTSWDALAGANIVNIGRNPELADVCLPFMRVDMEERACFVGGAVLYPDDALSPAGSPVTGTSLAVVAPVDHDQTDFAVPAGTLNGQVQALAEAVQGVLDGTYPLHDVTQDGAWSGAVYAASFHAGVAFGGATADALLESEGNNKKWVHSDTDSGANPGTIFDLEVHSARSGNTGENGSIRLVASGGFEPYWEFYSKKNGAATQRPFLYGNGQLGTYAATYPTDDDALDDVVALTACADGITATTGFGSAVSFGYSASSDPDAGVVLGRVGASRIDATAGKLEIELRKDSATQTVVTVEHDNGVKLVPVVLDDNAAHRCLRLEPTLAAECDAGFGSILDMGSRDERGFLRHAELKAVRLDATATSAGELELQVSDGTTLHSVAVAQHDKVYLYQDVEGSVSVDVSTVTAGAQFVGPNVAFAWASVAEAAGVYSLQADGSHNVGSVAATGTGVIEVTLSAAFPRTSGGVGIGAIFVTPKTAARIGTAVPTTTTVVTVSITNSAGAAADCPFFILVYALR